jgi:hypothetical protein
MSQPKGMNESPENAGTAAPQNPTDWAVRLSHEEAERIRSARLKDEAALNQYVLSLTGGYVLLSAVSLMAALSPMPPRQPEVMRIMATVFTSAAFASILTNFGVRRSASWSRRPLIVLCYLVLPVPVLRTFGRCTLQLLRANKMPRLLSSEYEFLVRRTESLNERTSFMTWFAIVLICLIIVSVIAIAQLPRELRHMK